MTGNECIERETFTDTEKELYHDIWDGLGIQDYADECIWKKARVENCALSLSKKGYRKHIKTPAADVEEVRHGKWKAVYSNNMGIVYECSECGHLTLGTSDYCICGAKMNGGTNE